MQDLTCATRQAPFGAVENYSCTRFFTHDDPPSSPIAHGHPHNGSDWMAAAPHAAHARELIKRQALRIFGLMLELKDTATLWINSKYPRSHNAYPDSAKIVLGDSADPL